MDGDVAYTESYQPKDKSSERLFQLSSTIYINYIITVKHLGSKK